MRKPKSRVEVVGMSGWAGLSPCVCCACSSNLVCVGENIDLVKSRGIGEVIVANDMAGDVAERGGAWKASLTLWVHGVGWIAGSLS